MRIALCCSAKFFDKIPEIKKKLEELGFEVFVPKGYFKHIKDSHGEDHFAKIHFNLIKEHFKRIERSDAILVLNFDKDGVKGKIGGNTFLEMGKAFDEGITIFLWNPIPEIDYKEEILAMHPIVINGDLSKIKIGERVTQRFPEPTVGALILNSEGKIFLMKSPKWRNGNLWTFPGGHIEIGEDWETALKREVKEEVGLDIEVIKLLNIQQAIFPKDFWRKRHYIFLDFVCRAKNENVKLDGREAIEFAWIKPKEALKLKLNPYVRKNIEKYLENEKVYI